MIDARERASVYRSCRHFFGHPPRGARERLLEIAEAAGPAEYPDRYGGGELLESFESELAGLLGKEAAAFMPSGTMAQQIALRVQTDRRANPRVGLHPQSHLVQSEADALVRLHGLQPVPLGDRYALYGLEDLAAVREPLGALLVELPERNLGGALRPWSDVTAICDWARERGTALHLDGARLWECGPFYGMTAAQMAAPFDTVYVSFYKVLDGVAGAALAGPKAIVDEARLWQWRHGGRLVQQYPLVLSAREGLRRYLPRVERYAKRARELAEIFAGFAQATVTPNPPHTNMFHTYVRGDVRRLEPAALQSARETGVWLVGGWQPTPVPGWHAFELSCAEGALHLEDERVRASFARLLEIAEAQTPG